MAASPWPPPRPRVRRAVAIPSSALSPLREPARTLHAAFLARALAIFRVEEVLVYREGGVPCAYLEKILTALEVPQYLRRYLVPLERTYRYLGLAPPLAAPSHQLRHEDLPFREGVVVRASRGVAEVDAGLDKPVVIEGRFSAGDRVTLRREGSRWVVADRDSLGVYWGYRVRSCSSLREALELSKGRYLVVFTSRRGEPLQSVAERLKRDAEAAGGLLLVYGTWDKGVQEIAEREGISLGDFSPYLVNVAVNQGTRTIRTEEAVLISLSLINYLLS